MSEGLDNLWVVVMGSWERSQVVAGLGPLSGDVMSTLVVMVCRSAHALMAGCLCPHSPLDAGLRACSCSGRFAFACSCVCLCLLIN